MYFVSASKIQKHQNIFTTDNSHLKVFLQKITLKGFSPKNHIKRFCNIFHKKGKYGMNDLKLKIYK